MLLYSLCLNVCTSVEVLQWQLGIIPQLAPVYEVDTLRQPSESVDELDLD